LYELFAPTEVSPEDLSTLGEEFFDGAVQGAFSAHPHSARGAIYNIGLRTTPLGSTLDLYELGDAVRHLAALPVGELVSMHDFMVTPHYVIAFGVPLRFRWADWMAARGVAFDYMEWKPAEGTEVFVIPIDRPKERVRFTVDPFFLYHFANAYERGDELVVDYCRIDDYKAQERYIRELIDGEISVEWNSKFHRAVIDPKRRTMRTEERWSRSAEFPRVAPADDGAPYQHAYLAAHGDDRKGPFTRIARLDVETGRAAEFEFGQACSEPIFADGYVLTLVHDGATNTSGLAILDARNIEAGPIARAWFNHHIPITFHGTWVTMA